jgi:hypothetical protein
MRKLISGILGVVGISIFAASADAAVLYGAPRAKTGANTMAATAGVARSVLTPSVKKNISSVSQARLSTSAIIGAKEQAVKEKESAAAASVASNNQSTTNARLNDLEADMADVLDLSAQNAENVAYATKLAEDNAEDIESLTDAITSGLTGIAADNLSDDVQDALGLAETAVQPDDLGELAYINTDDKSTFTGVIRVPTPTFPTAE